MSNIRVVVVDDEPLARERVVTLVRETPGLQLVGEASDGLQALDLIATLAPDLVFLDVEMPELDGFDVAAAIQDVSLPGVIFVTAYEEYAMRAFEVDAIDYLQKPVTRSRFDGAVRRALGRLAGDRGRGVESARMLAVRRRQPGQFRTRFVVRRGSTHTFVGTSEIVWIDSVDNYLQLHAGNRTHLVRGTMKDAEQELDPEAFIRIHRSAIVSIAHIVAIDAHAGGGYTLRFADGTRLRTSRQYAPGIRALVAPRPR